MTVQRKVGPTPPEIFNRPQAEPAGLEWFTNMISIIEQQATTTNSGSVGQATAQSDSVAATVADLRTDFNALLARLRTAGMMDE